MSSYWDPIQHIEVVRILAGEYYATHCDEMITTVLGSCISACIRDKVTRIGGMNHFMLPAEKRAENNGAGSAHGLSADAAYGSYAMERLINCILKYGGRRENLEIKIFGGGRIMNGMSDIGGEKTQLVPGSLCTEGFSVGGGGGGGTLPLPTDRR